MKKNVLKVGIAGYGIVGKRRQVYIDLHPNMKTVAVCDQKFNETGVDQKGVKQFKTYRELLNEDLDALFVCVPNYIAAEVTIAGLELGLHVFCEKPPAKTVKEVEAVVAVSIKHPNLKLKYGFNHRYHDSVRQALHIIKSGDLGEIINIRGVYGKSMIVPFTGGWRSEKKYAGGGILLDQGIHMVDLMRLFCGEFIEIKSFISNDFWKCDVEDNAYALMKDKKGRVAMLHSTATQWEHKFLLEIGLSKGYLRLQGILTGTKSYGEEQLVIGFRTDDINGADRSETIKYLKDDSWADEVNEFGEAVLNDLDIKSGTVYDALETMTLVFKIYGAEKEWNN